MEGIRAVLLEMCLHSFALPWRWFLADAHFSGSSAYRFPVDRITRVPPPVPTSHCLPLPYQPVLALYCSLELRRCFTVALLSIAIRFVSLSFPSVIFHSSNIHYLQPESPNLESQIATSFPPPSPVTWRKARPSDDGFRPGASTVIRVPNTRNWRPLPLIMKPSSRLNASP